MDIQKTENKELYGEGVYDIGQEIHISKEGYKLLLILLLEFNKLYADTWGSKAV